MTATTTHDTKFESHYNKMYDYWFKKVINLLKTVRFLKKADVDLIGIANAHYVYDENHIQAALEMRQKHQKKVAAKSLDVKIKKSL